jgi:hypothetical protein
LIASQKIYFFFCCLAADEISTFCASNGAVRLAPQHASRHPPAPPTRGGHDDIGGHYEAD